MTENILNNKNNTTNYSSNTNIINTENPIFKSYKNFFSNDNPNLITGDTKSNERNEKNFMEDKVFVNVRDIIKHEKEKELENQKIYFTAKKSNSPHKEERFLKLAKERADIHGSVKQLKFYKTKKNNDKLKTIDNNNSKYTKNTNEDHNKNSKRNISAFTKQKTEYKMLNKKLLTKEQKTKTKAIFKDNKINNINNKNLLIKSTENFDKLKRIFKKRENDNQINDQNLDTITNSNTNTNNKLYEIKYESTLSPYGYEIKNNTERYMNDNLSDVNIKGNYDKNYTSNKKQHKKFNTKNHISKNIFLNTNAKFSSDCPDKKYKSFLTKNKNRNKLNNECIHNSQKNILSIDIINRIQAVKQNKTKNDFYRTIKVKNSANTINSHSINLNNKKEKTPVIKNKKNPFFKNRINKRIKNINGTKTKEDMQNYMSSFSIKVNKTTYNKENDKISRNKNLKKTWSKNMNNVVNQINNNIKNESKK